MEATEKPRRSPEQIALDKQAKIARLVERDQKRRVLAKGEGYTVSGDNDSWVVRAPSGREIIGIANERAAWTAAYLDLRSLDKRHGRMNKSKRTRAMRRNQSNAATLERRAARLAGSSPSLVPSADPEEPATLTGRKKMRDKLKAPTTSPEPRVKKFVVKAPDGAISEVRLAGRAIYKLEEQEIYAITRFTADWETAYNGGLRCAGFDPGVDGGNIAGGNVSSLAAVERLNALRLYLGSGDFSVLVAFAIHGAGASDFHKIGGPEHVVVTDNLKRILRTTASRYDPEWRPERTSLHEAAERINAAFQR